MNINYENKIKKELFCNIQVGECFAVDVNTPDQIICMKIWHDGEEDKAVALDDGELLCFNDDEEVVPISAELKVRLGG